MGIDNVQEDEVINLCSLFNEDIFEEQISNDLENMKYTVINAIIGNFSLPLIVVVKYRVFKKHSI